MKAQNIFTIQTINSEQTNALMAFVKALKMKFEISPDIEIPKEHQNLVLDRIKNSKEEDLLNWDDVKNDFDGI